MLVLYSKNIPSYKEERRINRLSIKYKSVRQRFITLYVALFAILGTASAQKAGVKTNWVGDALLSPNLALEVGLATRWTLDMSGEVNFWTVSDSKWKHWVFQPELRYWFCERFGGHFLGLHALGGEYNFGHIPNGLRLAGSDFSKLSDRRYQGWGIGAGLAYGYAWVLNEHWNLEAELGGGWIYTRYDVYPCAECGTKLESDMRHHYVGPTKLALSLVYLF